MKKIILLLSLLIFVVGCSNMAGENVEVKQDELVINEVSFERVKEVIDNYSEYINVDIIDVRTEEEYVQGHIYGAINIPLLNIEEIHIDKERELIIYCQTGVRSKEAFKILKELGYEKIFVMNDFNEWPYGLVLEDELMKEEMSD